MSVASRARIATAAIVTGLVVAACQSGAAAESSGAGPADSRPSPSDDAGRGVETSIFDIVSGDCFSIASLEEIETVRVVPCDQPHVYEVFAVVEHPAGEDEPYPGRDDTLEYSDAACRDEFEPYVGASYETSDLFITSVYPSAATWSLGDRAITCMLRAEDERRLTGSARDSGR